MDLIGRNVFKCKPLILSVDTFQPAMLVKALKNPHEKAEFKRWSKKGNDNRWERKRLKTQWAPVMVWMVNMNSGHDGTPPWELIVIIVQTIASDVVERGRGDEAHSERAREVVVLAAALVAEVKRVLLLPLVGVAEQDHLTQEGVYDHVLVVDLFAARGRKADMVQEKRGEKREKAISSHKREKYRMKYTRDWG